MAIGLPCNAKSGHSEQGRRYRNAVGLLAPALLSLLKIIVRRLDWLRTEACSLSGSTLIAMVQTANLREDNDVAGGGELYATGARAVHRPTVAWLILMPSLSSSP